MMLPWKNIIFILHGMSVVIYEDKEQDIDQKSSIVGRTMYLIGESVMKKRGLAQVLDPRAWLLGYSLLIAAAILSWDFNVLLCLFVIFVLLSIGVKADLKKSIHQMTMAAITILLIVLTTSIPDFWRYSSFSRRMVELPVWLYQFDLITSQSTLVDLTPLYAMGINFFRLLVIVSLSFLHQYFILQGELGAILHRFGIGDKLAFTIDLTTRLIPTLVKDFNEILLIQRTRGYELEKTKIPVIGTLAKMAPLIVPLTVHTFSASENLAEALELRAFGIGRRTWLDNYRYRWMDGLFILSSGIVLIVAIAIKIGGGPLN